MTDYGHMITVFLKENPDYMLVSGWVVGGVCMKMKALPRSDLFPQGREESDNLPLVGALKRVDSKELANALYELESTKTVVCARIEERGCTLEMRYTLPQVQPVPIAA